MSVDNDKRFSNAELEVETSIRFDHLFRELSGIDDFFAFDSEAQKRAEDALVKYNITSHPFFKHIINGSYFFSASYNTKDFTAKEAYTIAYNLQNRRRFSKSQSYKRLESSLRVLALEFFLIDQKILFTKDSMLQPIFAQNASIDGRLEVNEILFAEYFYPIRVYSQVFLAQSNENLLKDIKTTKANILSFLT